MSEATTKALTDLIYDRIVDLAEVDPLDNEEIYNLARSAAETIEAAGTTKAIVRAWCEEHGIRAHTAEWMAGEANGRSYKALGELMQHWAKAIREVSS